MSRVISSRSAAMVSTRNANHQGTTAAGRLPSACNRLPTSQAAAPVSNSAVCAARCRDTTVTFTAMKASEARTASQAAAAGIPASISTPDSAEAAGADERESLLDGDGALDRDDGAHEPADHQERMAQHGPTGPRAVARHRHRDAGAQQAADDARHQQGGDREQKAQRATQHGCRRRGVRSGPHGARVGLPAHEGLGPRAHPVGGPRRLPDQVDVDLHAAAERRGPAPPRRRRR